MIQASTLAPKIDLLFFTEVLVCGIVLIGILLTILYFSVKYAAHRKIDRSSPPQSDNRLELGWTIPSLIIFLIFFVWGANVYTHFRASDQADQEVFVVAKQWVWKFQYPDGRRDFNEIHIPINKKIKLTLISEDVIHSLFVPDFRIKQDILPGRYTTVVFKATKEGIYPLLCSQYCGVNHARMLAKVFAMNENDYRLWSNKNATTVSLLNPAESDMKLLGKQLFNIKGCNTCHQVADPTMPITDADKNEKMIGPSLWNLYERTVTLQDGTKILADDNYIHESVYNPNAKIVKGHPARMPTFSGLITEEEFQRLLAYIKSLKPKAGPK